MFIQTLVSSCALNSAVDVNYLPTPIAKDDDYSFRGNSTLTVNAQYGILSNDENPYENLKVVSQPKHGFLQLNQNGSFSYTPNNNYFGNDTFVYLMTNNAKNSEATVTLHVESDATNFYVVSTTVNEGSIHVQFNREVNPDKINLYDATSNPLGSSDVELLDHLSVKVRGSLIFDDDLKGFTFVKTNGPRFSADTYTLTLYSRSDGWIDKDNHLLDGNNDGTGGDNFVYPFTVSAPTTPIIYMREFVFGPGQYAYRSGAAYGMPVYFSSPVAISARTLSFTLNYNAEVFSLSEVVLNPSLSNCSLLSNSATNGLVLVNVECSSDLPLVETELFRLKGISPMASKISHYGKANFLKLSQVILNSGLDSISITNGLHINMYVGDINGDLKCTTEDTGLLSRIITGADKGSGSYPLFDAVILGDANASYGINVVDLGLLSLFLAGSASAIQPIP